MSLRIALQCPPHSLPEGDLRSCIEVARYADQVGLYSIQFGEHLVMGARTDRYPYGPWSHRPDIPFLEPMTTLGAMAAVTEHIRLSTGVLLAPLRSAILLAKMVATLDVLSSGRVELGVGTGWQREEYESAGIAWSSRRDHLDNTIAACRVLWGRQPTSFDSDTVSFHDVSAYPAPIQTRVPILYGMSISASGAASIARLGDGWCPVGLDIEGVRAGVQKLRSAFSGAGRDPAELRVRVHLPDVPDDGSRFDLGASLSAVPDLLDAGATIFGVSIPPRLGSMAKVKAYLHTLGEVSRDFAGA